MSITTALTPEQWVEILTEDRHEDTLMVLSDWMEETKCDIEVIESLRKLIRKELKPARYCVGNEESYDWWYLEKSETNPLNIFYGNAGLVLQIFECLNISNKSTSPIGCRFRVREFYESINAEEAIKEAIYAHARAVGIPIPGTTIKEHS